MAKPNNSSPLMRLVIVNQVAFNTVLVVLGVWLAFSGDRRGGFLVVLTLCAFGPFSLARFGLHRYLEQHLAAGFLWPLALAGVLFDWIMAAQIVGARETAVSALQSTGIAWVGPFWFSAHALLLLGYGVFGLAQFARAFLRRLGRRPPAAPRTDESTLGRRELFQKAGLLGAALPFGVSMSSIPLSYDFRVEKREIVLPHWPPALDGLRVVHLSDIHVGGAMDHDRLQRVAELTNSCKPDLVLHTGDFLTHRSGEFDEPLYAAVAAIDASYGQWGCLGNHDYEDAERFESRMRESGATILRNRLVTIPIGSQMLEVGGLEFAFNRRGRAAIYAQAMQAWGPRRLLPRILLNHDPSGFAALSSGAADLVLSGHTHGGHIGVQLTPSTAITVVGLAGIPDQGVFTQGDMRMYVTRCVGFYGYPMRIGIPPEVALLVLRSAEVAGKPSDAGRV